MQPTKEVALQNLKRSLLAGLVATLLLAAPVWAQETGSISGTVTDPDGAPLPGVAVTLESVSVPTATVYTQANGVYRFPVLPPGNDYKLTFQLEGFKTVVQEGIGVRVGGNTQISVSMELSSVEETVTVTGTAPIVDVKKTSIGNNVTEQYMQSIPSARDPWVMLEHTAGVQVDRQNIGGSESGQQSGFTANGAPRSDSVWTYDGAEITDMAALGASPMYYDFDAFEEISISTGGNDPSIATGGIRINFVTKRGGNRWRGSGRFYITDESLQADTVADPNTGELTGDFTADELFPGYIGNTINNIKDFGGEIGGPVVRDRFFVWGAYGKQDIKQNVGRSPDNTQLQNWHAKANWHLGDKAVLNYTFVRANKTKQGRGASATRPPETTFNQGGPSPIHTGKLQYTIDDNNYVEGTFNYTGLGFFLEPQGGRNIQPSLDLGTGMWGNSYFFYDTDRPLYNAKVDGNSYIAGSNVDHELKYGYSFRDADVSSIWGPAGGAIAVFFNGTPVSAWLIQDALSNYKGQRHSVYAGDTISAGRVTINAGLRFDRQTSEAFASSVAAHPAAPDLFPAVSFPGFDPGFGWNSVSPRFGLTYDLSGDSTTVLKVNAARYYSQMAAWELALGINTDGPEMDFAWNDLNGNGQVDTGETGALFWVSPGFDPANPGAPRDILVDETSAPWSDELIVGIEHELSRSFGIGGHFIYRKNGNANWTIRTGENDDAFWTPVTQNVAGFGDITVYEPVGPRSTQQHYFERPDYNTTYTGVELFLTKRFSDRWMANASLTLADTAQNFNGPGSYTDPTNIARLDGQSIPIASGGSGRSGTFYGSATWYLKASGMYQFPGGFSLAGFFQAREGYINPQFVRSNNRAFGAGRVNAFIEDFGDTKLPTYWDLDLRAEKTFDLADTGRIHFVVDAFNVFNNDIVLARHNQVNSSVHKRIREVMQGRTVRFGVRLVLR